MRGEANRCSFSPIHAWAVLLLLAGLVSVPLPGQVGRSGVTGTVTDPSGAVVVGAKVTVRNESTNVELSTEAGETGSYFIRGLPVGVYSITVQAPGFETVVTQHVQTEVEKVSSLDVKLALGAAAQSVTVEAAVSLVNSVSGTVGHLVTNKEAEGRALGRSSSLTIKHVKPGRAKFRGKSISFDHGRGGIAGKNFHPLAEGRPYAL